jgi:hypothetical protein
MWFMQLLLNHFVEHITTVPSLAPMPSLLYRI